VDTTVLVGALSILGDRVNVFAFISYPWKVNIVKDGDLASKYSCSKTSLSFMRCVRNQSPKVSMWSCKTKDQTVPGFGSVQYYCVPHCTEAPRWSFVELCSVLESKNGHPYISLIYF
jgi:hypothetical protein